MMSTRRVTICRERRLNFSRVRLYTYLLLRAIPRQRRAVRREAGIVNAEGFRFLQGASEWRGRAGYTAGSRHRRRRSVPGTADIRLAAGVCHRDTTTCDEMKLLTRLIQAARY